MPFRLALHLVGGILGIVLHIIGRDGDDADPQGLQIGGIPLDPVDHRLT